MEQVMEQSNALENHCLEHAVAAGCKLTQRTGSGVVIETQKATRRPGALYTSNSNAAFTSDRGCA